MIKTNRDCNHPQIMDFSPGFPMGDSNPIPKFDKPYVGVDQSSLTMTKGPLLIVAPTSWATDNPYK